MLLLNKNHQDFWLHQNPHLKECLGVLSLGVKKKKVESSQCLQM